jgi:hypothetical protein
VLVLFSVFPVGARERIRRMYPPSPRGSRRLARGVNDFRVEHRSSGVSSHPSLREEDEFLVTSHGMRH